jgi:hypothetical protein
VTSMCIQNLCSLKFRFGEGGRGGAGRPPNPPQVWKCKQYFISSRSSLQIIVSYVQKIIVAFCEDHLKRTNTLCEIDSGNLMLR